MTEFQSVQEIESNIARNEVPHRDKKAKRSILRVPTSSKPPKNAVQIREEPVETYFKWSLVLLITCFFIIGPIWAFARTFRVKQLVNEQNIDAATRLSNRIGTVLFFSTIIGIFAWIVILFCSVGLLLTGVLLNARAI